MPVSPLRAVLALASLFAAPALAQAPAQSSAQAPAPTQSSAPTITTVYPGHWGGPFGLWYGGWQPEMVVNGPNPAAPPAQWHYPAAGYDRDGWLRECRRQRGGTAEDRVRGPDRCEAMLAAPPPAGYGSGYGLPAMLVPVILVPAGPPPAAGPAPPCKATVVTTTEEYYAPAPRRARHIAPRRAPDKRVRLAPGKRVPQ